MPDEYILKSVDDFAKKYGNKSANLIELSHVCDTILKTESDLKVQIPSICPLTHDLIFSHLSHFAPEWATLWNDFIKIQTRDGKEITDKGKVILDQIKKLIIKTFEEHQLSDSSLEEYLRQFNFDVDLLMVRSTGKEDTKDLANPGGNESVAAVQIKQKSISSAIGIVVASYFSEKSLKQRLLGKDDITQPPFMPVLIQKMVGEVLGGEKYPENVIRSGVMYTGKRGTRIQAAPGHGELIVNSKAPFDSFYVTREEVVHSEIHRKLKRLIPIEQQTPAGTKRTLQMVDNLKRLRDSPALSEQVIRRLARIGQLIEDHYGEPMDVEFVYDPAKDVINIVQARPIPVGNLLLYPPSSIKSEKLTTLKESGLIQKGSVITAGGSAARVITSQDEILVCQTIEQALNIYLSKSRSKVKAVIVKNDAPETSHEAAQFNSKAIPVLKMDDIENLQKQLDKKNIAFIVDPQRKQIVDVSSHYDQDVTEKESKITSDFIQEGIFKSPMTAQETLQRLFPSRNFKFSTFYRKSERIPIGKMLDDIHSKNSSIANTALNNLMRTLYEIIKDGPKKAANFKNMPMLLEEIENAIPGTSNLKSFEALQMILNRFVSLAKNFEEEGTTDALTDTTLQSQKNAKIIKDTGNVPKELFRQAMITGAEIYHILQEMSGIQKYDLKDRNAMRVELLNLVVKLEALISAPVRPGLLSSSLYQWATEENSRIKAQSIPGYETLSLEQREYFIAMLQLKNIGLSKEISEAWTQFALQICKDNKKIQQVADLLLFIQKFKVSSDWLNERFVFSDRNGEISPEEFLKKLQEKKIGIDVFENTFERIMNEITITKNELENLNLNQTATILSSWEQKLVQFADEEKFPKLWKEFNEEIVPLIDKLDVHSDLQPLTQKSIFNLVLQLTEIIDHSIKAMKGSPTYQDKRTQIDNFYKMLEPYFRLMKIWMYKVPDDIFSEFSKRIIDKSEYNTKNEMLSQIEDVFKSLKSQQSDLQLLPSESFSVASACFDSGSSFNRHFMHLKVTITLEDLFTLMHQNTLSALQQLQKPLRKSSVPEPLQPLIKAIETIECRGSKTKLLNTDHQYPILRLDYNISLRNHSGKITLLYDQVLGTCKIQGKFFGHNQKSRMTIVNEMANNFPLLHNIKIVSPSIYNGNKRLMEFSWELNPDQLSTHAEKINEELSFFSKITYYENYGGPSATIDSFLRRNIETRYDLTKKIVSDLLSSEYISRKLEKYSKEILESMAKWPKSEIIDFISQKIYKKQPWLLEELPKYFSKQDLYDLALIALKKTRLDLINVLPELREALSEVEIKTAILNSMKSDQNSHDYMLSAISIAIKNGYLDIVKNFVEQGIDVNQILLTGESLIHLAASKGHLEIVKYLAEHNADVNKQANDDSTAIFGAAQNGHLDVIKYLIEHRADVNKSENDGASPIFIAVYNSHLDVVKCLAEAGADVNKAESKGATPIFVAVDSNNYEFVKLLLEINANPNPPHYFENQTPFEAAQDSKIKKLLLIAELDLLSKNISVSEDKTKAHTDFWKTEPKIPLACQALKSAIMQNQYDKIQDLIKEHPALGEKPLNEIYKNANLLSSSEIAKLKDDSQQERHNL